MGFVYGPLGAWLPGLFPARVRYTGASLAFNVGGILGGALAPIIAQALADRGGLWLVGLYLAGAALVSLALAAVDRRGPTLRIDRRWTRAGRRWAQSPSVAPTARPPRHLAMRSRSAKV